MAKNFPYFKFIATEWMTGDIVFEDLSVQGLFINICALYWQRNGELSIDDINKRFRNPDELPKLSDRFITVNNGFITIKFLDEQLDAASQISAKNSQNGSKGGRPKALKTLEEKPTAKRPLSDRKANESKEEEEKNKNKKEDVIESITATDKIDFDKNEAYAKILKSSESESWLETVAMQSRKNPELVISKIDQFVKYLASVMRVHNSKRDFVEHFINWLAKDGSRASASLVPAGIPDPNKRNRF